MAWWERSVVGMAGNGLAHVVGVACPNLYNVVTETLSNLFPSSNKKGKVIQFVVV